MSGTPRRKPGRMGAHIEPFRQRLLAAGYTPGTVRGLLMVMGQLGRWMSAEAVADDRLSNADFVAFCRFLESRPAQRMPRLRSAGPLVSYLRDAGVLEPSPVAPVTTGRGGVGWVSVVDDRRAWSGGRDGVAL
jgi:integrase/recombinase XerD